MNICLHLGLVLCAPIAMALVAWMYVKWIAYLIDRYDDNIGMIYTLAFAPLAVPGIILLVIGLIQRVI